jgi:tRNA threonylcarbamoyl adenosine modification protein (Sua5/YciO/YrdC/YwlC family)
MSKFYKIHPENPQSRLIRKSVEIIKKGGLIAYPTDSGYGLGCHLEDKKALDKIQSIRKLDKNHNFTLLCRDLSEISKYARLDTPVFRIIKAHTPGPYTFILRATREVPRRLLHPQQKTVGIRIPDNKIDQSILYELKEPLMTTSLIFPGEKYPCNDPQTIPSSIQKKIELIISGGYCSRIPTSVIDLTEKKPKIVRKGKGDIKNFL